MREKTDAKARTRARLVLEDGAVFEGEAFGGAASTAGEVVFNTGMVGYPETLSDPSYSGQILVMTYPLVGNYGVPEYKEDKWGVPVGFESDGIKISGLVVSELSPSHSHFKATRSLDEWMASENVPGIFGVDTRAITKRLRQKGSMLGRIEILDEEIPFVDPNVSDLVATVTPREVTKLAADADNAPTIVILDCGCKAGIVRSMTSRGVNVVRVPYDHYFLDIDFDGLLISNGPGDPKMCAATIKHVEHALAVGKPILGICLGHQLLALAAGAETYKLKFGHRSQNQPCIERAGDTLLDNPTSAGCVITSQNHGYAVREETLPAGWEVWFKNANDDTVEGIRHQTKPFRSVQFHPEANPGPLDTTWILDMFVEMVLGGAR